MPNQKQAGEKSKTLSLKVPVHLVSWMENEKKEGRGNLTEQLLEGLALLRDKRLRLKKISDKFDAMTREGLADADAGNLISTEEMLAFIDSLPEKHHDPD
jgi:hypothetical protein